MTRRPLPSDEVELGEREMARLFPWDLTKGSWWEKRDGSGIYLRHYEDAASGTGGLGPWRQFDSWITPASAHGGLLRSNLGANLTTRWLSDTSYYWGATVTYDDHLTFASFFISFVGNVVDGTDGRIQFKDGAYPGTPVAWNASQYIEWVHLGYDGPSFGAVMVDPAFTEQVNPFEATATIEGVEEMEVTNSGYMRVGTLYEYVTGPPNTTRMFPVFGQRHTSGSGGDAWIDNLYYYNPNQTPAIGPIRFGHFSNWDNVRLLMQVHWPRDGVAEEFFI